MLQALFGAWLLQRFAAFPNALATEKQVLQFMLFGGLLSPMVNSTLGISALIMSGKMPAADFLGNWGIWWVGDAIGILILTPLALAWLFRPKDYFAGRQVQITLAISCSFILAIFLVLHENKIEIEHVKLLRQIGVPCVANDIEAAKEIGLGTVADGARRVGHAGELPSEISAGRDHLGEPPSEGFGSRPQPAPHAWRDERDDAVLSEDSRAEGGEQFLAIGVGAGIQPHFVGRHRREIRAEAHRAAHLCGDADGGDLDRRKLPREGGDAFGRGLDQDRRRLLAPARLWPLEAHGDRVRAQRTAVERNQRRLGGLRSEVEAEHCGRGAQGGDPSARLNPGSSGSQADDQVRTEGCEPL